MGIVSMRARAGVVVERENDPVGRVGYYAGRIVRRQVESTYKER